MGYKLADGSDSDLYEVGDTFLVAKNENEHFLSILDVGDIVELVNIDPELLNFTFTSSKGGSIEDWSIMRPTAKTIKDVKKRNNHNPTMQTLEVVRQQPCVPIQFVWEGGTLSHIDAVNAESWICFENCEVEQIGAVLYVRSSDE